MKHILIYSFSFLLQFNFVLSQTKNQVKDSVITKKVKKPVTIFLGIDLFSQVQRLYSEKNAFKGFIHIQSEKKIAYVLEIGYEKNNFNNLNWKVDVAGIHYSLGLNYFLAIDKMENKFNGFYLGGRISNSLYNQEVKSFPVYGKNTSELVYVGSLNQTKINSTWLEMVLGGRVDLIKKKLYADIAIRPKLHLFTTKQENIKPLIIPGFGVNQNNLTTDLQLAIVYQINFNKNNLK